MKILFFVALITVGTSFSAHNNPYNGRQRFHQRPLSLQEWRCFSYISFFAGFLAATQMKDPSYQLASVSLGFGISQWTNKTAVDQEKKNINFDMLMNIEEAHKNPLTAARIIQQQKQLQSIERNRAVDKVVLTSLASVAGASIGIKTFVDRKRKK